jgi:capsular exopolysaccharide synthesis family protein
MPQAPDTKGDLKYYIDLLLQRRLLIGVAFIVTFLMIMIDYIVTPPTYTAKAKLLIEPERYTNFNTQTQEQEPQNLYFQTQVEIIKSEPVLSLAAKSLGLQKGTPDFENMILKLKKNTSVERVQDSRILTIYVKSRNPLFAANAANAIIDSYIRFLDEQKKRRISNITMWLQGELTSLKNKVEQSEMALIKYVEQQEATSNSDTVMFLGDPSDNAGTKALSELETKYITLQIELTNLLQKYKDKYPLVVQLKNDIKALNIRINMMKQAMLEANKKRIQYLMLSRDAQLSKDLYSMLTKELKEINVFGEIGYPTATIIEHATEPVNRSDRSFVFWFFFGIFISAIVGIASAFVADQIDSSIKGESDIERFIKYPIIGALPYLEELKGKEPHRLLDILNSASSQVYVEMLRLLRTNLKYSFVAKEGKVLLVTSTGENEGKTTLSVSLAYILSITGAKVLIIDSDVKKPAIHSFFKAEQVPGYTELLIDEKLDVSTVIKNNGYSNLFYITAGRQPPDFAELLDSQRSKELMAKLKNMFDYIIIDSPPIGIISDAAILSSMVDGTIFVVKANGYPREHVMRGIKSLSSINAKITGIVLTHLDKGKGYYYRDYYYKSYYRNK